MAAAELVNGFPGKKVEAAFNYFLDESLGGSRVLYSPTASLYRRKYDENFIQVQDIRGAEDNFDLDIQGFQICKHGCTEEIPEDESAIKSAIYAETAEFLKKMYVKLFVGLISHSVSCCLG